MGSKCMEKEDQSISNLQKEQSSILKIHLQDLRKKNLLMKWSKPTKKILKFQKIKKIRSKEEKERRIRENNSSKLNRREFRKKRRRKEFQLILQNLNQWKIMKV